VCFFCLSVGHLLGICRFFLGAEAINRYGYFLQSNVEVLWPVRVFLLAMLVLHVWSATRLSIENKAARPVAYAAYPAGGFELRIAHDADERRHRFCVRDLPPAALTP